MILILEQAWAQREKILLAAAAALLLWVRAQHGRIRELEQLLEAKPRVETKIETRVVKGPVRVVEKIVEKPGGERIITREIERAESTIDRSSTHLEVPACPTPARAPRWIFALGGDPLQRELRSARAGISFGSRLDLSYLHSVQGPSWQAVELAGRF